MTMTRNRPRVRATGRLWVFPSIHDYYERIEDGRMFQVKNIYRRDMQVRLEACVGREVHHPFLSMLETDYRKVVAP